MKIRRFLFSFVFVLLPVLSAIAGTRDGGGGVGVRCPTPNGSSTLELLDIHEARLRGETFVSVPTAQSDVASFLGKRFGDHNWFPDYKSLAQLESETTQFFAGMLAGQKFYNPYTATYVTISKVMSVALSNDYGTYHIRPGCSLEQVAYMDDQLEQLYIAANWSDLDGLSQAALLLHEAVYLAYRYQGLEYAGTTATGTVSSEHSREFVGRLLSEQGLPNKFPTTTQTGIECMPNSYQGSGPVSFYVLNSGSDAVHIFVEYIEDYESPFTEEVILQGLQTSDFLQPKQSQTLNISAPLSLLGETDPGQFNFKLMKATGVSPVVQFTRVLNGTEVSLGDAFSIACDVAHPSPQ